MSSISGIDWNSPTTQILAVVLIGGGIYWYLNSGTGEQGQGLATASRKVARAENAESVRQGIHELQRASDNDSVFPYVSTSEASFNA